MNSCGFDPSIPQKPLFRREAKRRLSCLSPEDCALRDAQVVSRVVSCPEYAAARTVLCYVSRFPEPNTAALLRQILADGKTLCLPRCDAKDDMTAREVRDLTELVPDVYGIPAPAEDAPVVPAEEIDLCILPCLAATASGVRLGHGKGCFDRFLAGYGGRLLVLCRRETVFPTLPREPHDVLAHRVIDL